MKWCFVPFLPWFFSFARAYVILVCRLQHSEKYNGEDARQVNNNNNIQYNGTADLFACTMRSHIQKHTFNSLQEGEKKNHLPGCDFSI